MSVEMSILQITEIINDDSKGWFCVENYNYLVVSYECKNGVLLFQCTNAEEEEEDCFSKWLLNEGELYTTFLLNYLDEIKKINNKVSFKGKLIEEFPLEEIDKQYEIVIQYNEIPNNVDWTFIPKINKFNIFYQIPIPINSRGQYGGGFIEDILEYETMKRMWEPFRSKTRYRMELLHMLR